MKTVAWWVCNKCGQAVCKVGKNNTWQNNQFYKHQQKCLRATYSIKQKSQGEPK